MEVLTGDLTLDVKADDERQTYVEGNTSAITFDVNASGTTDAPENVDLKVSQSGSSDLLESPRSDRETIDLDGGSEEFTLTWEPDWNDVGGGTYDVLVEGESDQSFARVRVIQEGGAFVEVETLDHNAPVEYGDDLTATVRAENVGDTEKEDTIELSVADSCCPNEATETVTLGPGNSTNVTLTYDTGELDTDSIGEVKMVAQSSNFNSKDTREVEITEPTIIEDPTVEDVQAGQERLTQRMEFRLGEDTSQAEIKIDLSDTGDAVSYDPDSDANWTVEEGHGSISLNTDNGVANVKYTTNSSHDLAGDRIVLEADYTDTTDADVNSIVKYDVPFTLTNAENYPAGETNSTSFETTLGQHIDVEIVDPGTPVEYGEHFNATVRVKNEGSVAGDAQIQLSVDGVTGPEETVPLEPDQSENVTMTYDTDQLSTSSIGDAELEAETNDDTDSRTVTIEPPTLIEEPFVENVSAGQEQLNQSMGFTLGEDTDQAEIKIDLTDTSDAVSYDSNADSNWTVVEGNGSISLNTNNDRVTSVKYTTHSTDDRAGDEIVIAADYTDTTGAESGQVYDILYEVTPNTDSYNNDETNSTSFETT
jgi:hypothetical protein